MKFFYTPSIYSVHVEENLSSFAWCVTGTFLFCNTFCVVLVKVVSSTITIRIPRELKKKMKENPAEWSCEIRCFLEERVKQIELLKGLKEIEARAEKRNVKVDSVTLIREDRER